jgi:uncharacterized membrane protein
MEFLSWIEHSAFSVWVRESPSIFAYAGVVFLHTVGLAIVVGISAMIDLRLLGVASDLPIAPLERFFPIMWAGFWINAVSGSILLAQDATTKFTNPIFGIKMVLIALAVVDMVLLRRVVFRGPQVERNVSGQGRLLAVASLVLWFGATTAGRLMTYLGTVSGVPGLENRIGS